MTESLYPEQYCQENNLSVRKFAEMLDIPERTLSGYERSERTPTAPLFIKLHNICNVNLNWFVSGEGNMFNSEEDVSEDVLTQKVEAILKKNNLI